GGAGGGGGAGGAPRGPPHDREAEVARYLASNEEVGEVVAALEQQYDAFERAETEGSSLLATNQPLPTGEEIGQQFEQFLAGLDGPDADEPGPDNPGEQR
ncbi:MAG: hypothetical protein WKF50_06830, partial [Nocardioides sp.]